MQNARLASVLGLGLCLVAFAAAPAAMAQGGLAAYQGAWLSGRDCAEVYAPTGKGTAFKKPVDIFASAFIISGNSLRTPQASCRIKSARPSGDCQLLILSCANAVSGNEVQVLMAPQPDGSLKRYFNAEDTTGTTYKHCSR